MPVIRHTTFSLFAFAVVGCALTLLAPEADQNVIAKPAYAIAISTGNGMRLTTRTNTPSAEQAGNSARSFAASTAGSDIEINEPPRHGPATSNSHLTCETVMTIASVEIGTQCARETITIAAQD